MYEKTFPRKEVVFKQLAKMVKRVDKHLNEDTIKMKLRQKIRGKLIGKLETSIHEVLPEKVLTPWPEIE